MEGRVLVAGETDESRFSLLLGLIEGLQHAAGGVRELGVVVVDDPVDLPEVQVICLEPPERLFEHLQGELPAPPVGADLGHQEDLVAPVPECPPEPVLGLAVVVLPAVVEERDTGVHCLVDEPDGVVHGREIAQVVTADTDGRHLDARATQRPPGELAGAGIKALARRGHGIQRAHMGTETNRCTQRPHASHEVTPGRVRRCIGRHSVPSLRGLCLAGGLRGFPPCSSSRR